MHKEVLLVLLLCVVNLSSATTIPDPVKQDTAAVLTDRLKAENVSVVPGWVKATSDKITNHVTQYISSRPELQPTISHCFLANITQEGGGCDIFGVSSILFQQFEKNPATQQLLSQIKHQGAFQHLQSTDNNNNNNNINNNNNNNNNKATKFRGFGGHGTRPAAASMGTAEPWKRSAFSFAHPTQLARDEFSTLMLWSFLWAWQTGVRQGERVGMDASSKTGKPFVSQVRGGIDRVVVWPLDDILPKWKVLHTLFPDFDRFYDVYTKESTNLRALGGVKILCRDFLPFVWTGFRVGPDLSWFQSGMSDVEHIFVPNPLNLAVKQAKSNDQRRQSTRKGLLESETDKIKNSEYYAIKFKLRKDWDDLVDYFGCKGQNNEWKLEYCTAATKRMGFVFSPNADEDLPKQDLRMCWKIMEAAVENFIPNTLAETHQELEEPPSGLLGKWTPLFRVFFTHMTLLPLVNLTLIGFCVLLSARYISSAIAQHQPIMTATAEDETCATTGLVETVAGGWHCPTTPIRGYRDFCVRSCPLTDIATDFRLRNTVVGCTDSGFLPSPANTILGNECGGSVVGTFSVLDLAPIDASG